MPDLFVGLRYTREAWRGTVAPIGENFSEDTSPEKSVTQLAERISALRPAAVLVQAIHRGELPVVVVLLERGTRVMVVTKERLRALGAARP
ncbi:hypothetical protein E5F05_02490 (plasmid) [Deinococcus metallilatus]|uniref:Uncharacterized protein n=1 Tax=Deinococcus metallilatus TaxID=1211322 RepID=A0ABR6MUX5_9DEIO|nr:hypothetical protein [Deinococcus metallilatus]MBB5295729.1 hypothetical protein [Deinococcus metallilatus]QBY06824.1 hypothetical protein E5F05_02490 [Deinococcus metallilatus]GMA14259.1 hypothetical protein GCM10025871_05900 [Deinococcus metallilatus]